MTLEEICACTLAYPPVTSLRVQRLHLHLMRLAGTHHLTAQAGPHPQAPLVCQSACQLHHATVLPGQLCLSVAACLLLLGGLALQVPYAAMTNIEHQALCRELYHTGTLKLTVCNRPVLMLVTYDGTW